MPAEFPLDVEVMPIFAASALEALTREDVVEHDGLVGLAAADTNVDTIAIAELGAARGA